MSSETVRIGRTLTPGGLRPVLLNGVDVGGCVLTCRRGGASGTVALFYPGHRRRGVQAVPFASLADLRARLPEVLPAAAADPSKAPAPDAAAPRP